MRWFERHMPAAGVTVRPCAMEYAGLSVAGPNSRALLQRLVRDDLSNAGFPFMSFRRMEIGMVPAYVGRVSFTGELGYEIWVTTDYQRTLYDSLLEAGRDLGLKAFGGRALNAMRIEKGFGTWAREYRPIYGPFEAGLGRFIDLSKGDFIGRRAAAAEKDAGGSLRLVGFTVERRMPTRSATSPSGTTASGGRGDLGAYGHRAGASLALGYVRAPLASAGGGPDEMTASDAGRRRWPAGVRSAGALIAAEIRAGRS